MHQLENPTHLARGADALEGLGRPWPPPCCQVPGQVRLTLDCVCTCMFIASSVNHLEQILNSKLPSHFTFDDGQILLLRLGVFSNTHAGGGNTWAPREASRSLTASPALQLIRVP